MCKRYFHSMLDETYFEIRVKRTQTVWKGVCAPSATVPKKMYKNLLRTYDFFTCYPSIIITFSHLWCESFQALKQYIIIITYLTRSYKFITFFEIPLNQKLKKRNENFGLAYSSHLHPFSHFSKASNRSIMNFKNFNK